MFPSHGIWALKNFAVQQQNETGAFQSQSVFSLIFVYFKMRYWWGVQKQHQKHPAAGAHGVAL